MRLPNDPVMLLSVVNTALRDKYNSLENMTDTEDIDLNMLVGKLELIGYEYKRDINQFV